MLFFYPPPPPPRFLVSAPQEPGIAADLVQLLDASGQIVPEDARDFGGEISGHPVVVWIPLARLLPRAGLGLEIFVLLQLMWIFRTKPLKVIHF